MSKANQAFKQNDEAVSPVIGVILMVAITVVLAAVVFVLVSNLGEGSEAAPNISFNKDSGALTLTVIQAEDAEWGDFEIEDPDADCAVEVSTNNGGSTFSAGNLGDATYAVEAGDVISLDETAAGDCEGQTVRIVHSGTNSLVYETTF